jgi:drug/metabolite transporter (DMT)-like permease
MDAGKGSAGPVAAQYGALAVTWGASFLFIKTGLEGLSPGQVVLGRLATGAVTLAVISAARRSRLPGDPVTWAHLAVVAVLLCDVPFLLIAWAEQRIPSSLASIYNAATPLMTVLWGLAVLPGERPTRARLAGLITGFAGVALVLGPWHLASRSQLLAQLACLAATACYGAAFTYLRRYVSPRGIAALPAATLQVSLAAVVALALAPWTATAPVRLSPAVTGSVLALGALGTGIAYVWNTGIVASWGATIASTVTYLIPIVGVVLGVAVLSEPLTWNEPAGAAIVILGILATQNHPARVARYIPLGLHRDVRAEAPPPAASSPAVPGAKPVRRRPSRPSKPFRQRRLGHARYQRPYRGLDSDSCRCPASLRSGFLGEGTRAGHRSG